MVKPGRRLKPATASAGGGGPVVDFFDNEQNNVLQAEIIDWGSAEGSRIVKLSSDFFDVDEAIHKVGATPLPPYIHGYNGDMEMYQTVYSAAESSAAAPTAGLHFTDELISLLRTKGIG